MCVTLRVYVRGVGVCMLRCVCAYVCYARAYGVYVCVCGMSLCTCGMCGMYVCMKCMYVCVYGMYVCKLVFVYGCVYVC